MSASHFDESNSESTDEFNRICQIAKSGNKEDIKEIVCVDIQRGCYTAARLLAEQGDDDAVRFLVESGANIDMAIRGAAAGNKRDLVMELLQKGANINWAAAGAEQNNTSIAKDISSGSSSYYFGCAVLGAAVGNHVSRVTAIMDEQNGLEFYALTGAAEGGHLELVQMLLSKYDRSDIAVYNLAMGGHKNALHEFLNDPLYRHNYALAIEGAAEGGQSFLNDLLDDIENVANEKFYKDTLNRVIEKIVENLLARGASLDAAVANAAEGGHEKLVRDLLAKGANLDFALRGVAAQKFKGANKLITFLSVFDDEKIRETFASNVFHLRRGRGFLPGVGTTEEILQAASEKNKKLQHDRVARIQIINSTIEEVGLNKHSLWMGNIVKEYINSPETPKNKNKPSMK